MDDLLDLMDAHPTATGLATTAVLALIPAWIAYAKGRSFLAWWVFGFLLLIVALPIALLIRRDVGLLEQRRMKRERLKRCEACGELIKREARVCRFCHQPVGGEARAPA